MNNDNDLGNADALQPPCDFRESRPATHRFTFFRKGRQHDHGSRCDECSRDVLMEDSTYKGDQITFARLADAE